MEKVQRRGAPAGSVLVSGIALIILATIIALATVNSRANADHDNIACNDDVPSGYSCVPLINKPQSGVGVNTPQVGELFYQFVDANTMRIAIRAFPGDTVDSGANHQLCLDDDNEPYSEGSIGSNTATHCTGGGAADTSVTDGTGNVPPASSQEENDTAAGLDGQYEVRVTGMVSDGTVDGTPYYQFSNIAGYTFFVYHVNIGQASTQGFWTAQPPVVTDTPAATTPAATTPAPTTPAPTTPAPTTLAATTPAHTTPAATTPAATTPAPTTPAPTTPPPTTPVSTTQAPVTETPTGTPVVTPPTETPTETPVVTVTPPPPTPTPVTPTVNPETQTPVETQPPTQPPTSPPTQPPTSPPTQPPTSPPTQPPTASPTVKPSVLPATSTPRASQPAVVPTTGGPSDGGSSEMLLTAVGLALLAAAGAAWVASRPKFAEDDVRSVEQMEDYLRRHLQ